MTIFGESPLTSYIWKSPPGSLPVQSTNFVSHSLSSNKALILGPVAWVNAEKYSNLTSLYGPHSVPSVR